MAMILKWWRERSTQEKWMMALIAMLLVGIVVRWAWVSSEVAGAFRERFSPPQEQNVPAGQTAPDGPDAPTQQTTPTDSLPR